MSKNHVLRISI